MTSREARLLKSHTYSFYTGNMGKVFNDWYDKKVNGTKAIQMLKRWHDKGIQKVNSEKYANIQKKELKRCFDTLALFIRDNDLVDEEEVLDNKKQEPKQHIQNELISKMIEKGILSEKGRKPLKNLDSVACFLVDENQSPTVATLMDLKLKKRNGKPYTWTLPH
jgi:hypothetical protein